ncbi:MAG: TetR/AcrR family transcriptional regulator [Sphingobium sp.]
MNPEGPNAGVEQSTPQLNAAGRRRGRPSVREAAAISDALLTAATDLFLAHGFEQTSMDMVSARVGVPRSTLYKRFSDKRALLREVIAVRVKRWSEINTRRNWVLSNDLEQRLVRYASWVLLWATSPEVQSFNRLALDAWPEPADTPERLRMLGQADLARLIEHDIRTYAAEPARIEDPGRVAFTLLAMIAGWLSFRSELEPMQEDEANELATYIVGFIMKGSEIL